MNPEDPTPSCRDPFDDALEAILSGEADARSMVILNETLRIDPEARAKYVRTMAFEGMLAAEFAPTEEAAPVRKTGSWRFPLSIAAAAILAAGLAWMWHPNNNAVATTDDTDNQDVTHAVISQLDDARGRFGGNSLSAGQRLSGGMLDLESGLAEITFDNGAEVTLEGPAKFLLESGNRSRLDSGRVSAIVPEQARGFVIHTPTSYIKDLGNAVSVEVRDDDETDLHVLEGEVEVLPTGRQAMKSPRVLRQMEALRLSGKDVETIQFKAERRIASKPKGPLPVPPSVHWSFDTWSGNTSKDASGDQAFKWIADRKPAAPDLVDGPFGQALRFDGGVFARSTYQTSDANAPRTVACWVRVPSDSAAKDGSNGIVAWSADRTGPKWQVSWNPSAMQGTIGAPRVELGEGYVVGSTDLRDGGWHHLAVVFLGGPRAGVASHVRLYVDGKLEGLTGRRQQRVKPAGLSSVPLPITLARSFGNRRDKENSGFEGELDELHVFEGALLPRQIVRLMKRNSLTAP